MSILTLISVLKINSSKVRVHTQGVNGLLLDMLQLMFANSFHPFFKLSGSCKPVMHRFFCYGQVVGMKQDFLGQVVLPWAGNR